MPQILEKNAMILRVNVGTATGPDGTVYELTNGAAGTMLVKSDKTGRTYALDWETVIRMAVEAGVNSDPA